MIELIWYGDASGGADGEKFGGGGAGRRGSCKTMFEGSLIVPAQHIKTERLKRPTPKQEEGKSERTHGLARSNDQS